MPLIFEANPKHKGATKTGSKMDLSDSAAQKLLNSKNCFAAKGNARIAVLGKKFYAFRMHEPKRYHGYPISGNEVCSKFPEVQDKVAKVLGIIVPRLARMR